MILSPISAVHVLRTLCDQKAPCAENGSVDGPPRGHDEQDILILLSGADSGPFPLTLDDFDSDSAQPSSLPVP